MKIHSPSNIEVLLHCHCTPGEHPRFEAPAVREALKLFKENGVIENTEGRIYRTTPLGRAWVQSLCDVEMPRTAFLDKDGKEIVIT